MIDRLTYTPPLVSIRDLAVSTVSILILLSISLPVIRLCREDSQQTECKSRLKHISQGLLEYESTFRFLPNCMGGTSVGDERTSNLGRLSGFVALIPYIEKSELYQQISTGNEQFRPMGPAPWNEQFEPWQSDFPANYLTCPSAPKLAYKISPRNFAFCIGDLARGIHKPVHPRGVFAPGFNTKLRDISDGLSTTISICEIGSLNGRMFAGQCAIEQPLEWLERPSMALTLSAGGGLYEASVKLTALGRGGSWADGAAPFGLVNTIINPNGVSVSFGAEATSDGLYSAGSFHKGGIHVAMADGTIRFLSHNLDCGDMKLPVPVISSDSDQPPSPYGCWGSIGTSSGGEVVPEFD